MLLTAKYVVPSQYGSGNMMLTIVTLQQGKPKVLGKRCTFNLREKGRDNDFVFIAQYKRVVRGGVARD